MTPLVSCIVPTRNRRPFLELALRWFDAQDWPDREMVVVDDGDDRVEDLVAHRPLVRCVRVDGRASIGAKRNLACSVAGGSIIAHWDDDDWFSPDRLRRQVEPILAGDADLTAFDCRFLLQLQTATVWGLTGRRRHGFSDTPAIATIAWRRAIFDAGARYGDQDLGEDVVFFGAALRAGTRVKVLRNDGAWVYSRHAGNTWQFERGRSLSLGAVW